MALACPPLGLACPSDWPRLVAKEVFGDRDGDGDKARNRREGYGDGVGERDRHNDRDGDKERNRQRAAGETETEPQRWKVIAHIKKHSGPSVPEKPDVSSCL